MTGKRILVIAPHADDETLGMGATIAKRAGNGDQVTVAIVTGHGRQPHHPLGPPESWDTVRAEARAAMAELGVIETIFDELPAVQVGETPAWEVNAALDRIVRECMPDELFVPFPYDLHGDHRAIFHALSVAWRPTTAHGRNIKRIACYETQSETHWNAPYLEPGFLPTHFEDIEKTWEKKRAALAQYVSQMRPFPDARSIEAIEALARWRGAQVGMRAAEAFVTIRTLG